MPTESTQWRKFLQPVVTGLVALMAAGVGYLQYLQRGESEKRDSRISVLEVQYTRLRIWAKRGMDSPVSARTSRSNWFSPFRMISPYRIV